MIILSTRPVIEDATRREVLTWAPLATPFLVGTRNGLVASYGDGR